MKTTKRQPLWLAIPCDPTNHSHTNLLELSRSNKSWNFTWYALCFVYFSLFTAKICKDLFNVGCYWI